MVRRIGRGRSLERNDTSDDSASLGGGGGGSGVRGRRQRKGESVERNKTDTSDDNVLAVFPSKRRNRSIERASDTSRDTSPYGQRVRGRGRERESGGGGRSGAGSR